MPPALPNATSSSNKLSFVAAIFVRTRKRSEPSSPCAKKNLLATKVQYYSFYLHLLSTQHYPERTAASLAKPKKAFINTINRKYLSTIRQAQPGRARIGARVHPKAAGAGHIRQQLQPLQLQWAIPAADAGRAHQAPLCRQAGVLTRWTAAAQGLAGVASVRVSHLHVAGVAARRTRVVEDECAVRRRHRAFRAYGHGLRHLCIRAPLWPQGRIVARAARGVRGSDGARNGVQGPGRAVEIGWAFQANASHDNGEVEVIACIRAALHEGRLTAQRASAGGVQWARVPLPHCAANGRAVAL